MCTLEAFLFDEHPFPQFLLIFQKAMPPACLPVSVVVTPCFDSKSIPIIARR